jgi:hypothetical protein
MAERRSWYGASEASRYESPSHLADIEARQQTGAGDDGLGERFFCA